MYVLYCTIINGKVCTSTDNAIVNNLHLYVQYSIYITLSRSLQKKTETTLFAASPKRYYVCLVLTDILKSTRRRPGSQPPERDWICGRRVMIHHDGSLVILVVVLNITIYVYISVM